MVERANTLEELSRIIKDGNPSEVIYDLGTRSKKTGLLATYVAGNRSYSARIQENPIIRLDGSSIDITDLNGNTLRDFDDLTNKPGDITDSYGTVQNAFRSLSVERGAKITLEQSAHQGDLGTAVIDLKNSRKLALALYARPE